MAEHKRFALATDIQVYFCDIQNPWQRGSNENTNGKADMIYSNFYAFHQRACSHIKRQTGCRR